VLALGAIFLLRKSRAHDQPDPNAAGAPNQHNNPVFAGAGADADAANIGAGAQLPRVFLVGGQQQQQAPPVAGVGAVYLIGGQQHQQQQQQQQYYALPADEDGAEGAQGPRTMGQVVIRKGTDSTNEYDAWGGGPKGPSGPKTMGQVVIRKGSDSTNARAGAGAGGDATYDYAASPPQAPPSDVYAGISLANGGPTELIYTSDAANNTYDKWGIAAEYSQPLNKEDRPVPQAPTLPVRRATKRSHCNRPAPKGGTCTNTPAPGGAFCTSHACPAAGCVGGKSSSEAGCSLHPHGASAGGSVRGGVGGAQNSSNTTPFRINKGRGEQSTYAGFEEEDV